MRHRSIIPVAVTAVILVMLTGCGSGDAETLDRGEQTTSEEPAADQGPDSEPAGDGTSPDTTDEESVQTDAQSAGSSADDRPQAYMAVYGDVEPAADTADGEVTASFGPTARDWVPFVAHNGTNGPVSRIEVSGRLVDDNGQVITSGRSQSVQPNVVPAGGWAFGFVYANAEQLPEGATVDDAAVDYAEQVDEFENIVTLEVIGLEATGSGFTGQVANPHKEEVTGPIEVTVACFDADAVLAGVFSTFADRDDLEAGDTSTFTAELYEDEADCTGLLAAASGYIDDF